MKRNVSNSLNDIQVSRFCTDEGEPALQKKLRIEAQPIQTSSSLLEGIREDAGRSHGTSEEQIVYEPAMQSQRHSQPGVISEEHEELKLGPVKESDIEINSTSLARLEGDVKVIGSELQSISQSLGVVSNKVDFICRKQIPRQVVTGTETNKKYQQIQKKFYAWLQSVRGIENPIPSAEDIHGYITGLYKNKQTRVIVAALKKLYGDLPVDWNSLSWDSSEPSPHHVLTSSQLKKCFTDDDLGLACRLLYEVAGRR